MACRPSISSTAGPKAVVGTAFETGLKCLVVHQLWPVHPGLPDWQPDRAHYF